MLRRLLLAVLAVALVAPSAALAAGTRPPLVYVGNNSSVAQQAVDEALPAFQTMVSRDLGSVWNLDATLTTDPAAEATAAMVIYLEDDSDACSFFGCALGYHGVVAGRPVARVFAASSAEWSQAWPLVFSHELEEMLVDPWVNRGALFRNLWWLVEVSDPVESGYYAYWIDGAPISDFITPAWYGGKGPFDFTHKLRRPGQLGRHGYASYWDPFRGGWGQVFADRRH